MSEKIENSSTETINISKETLVNIYNILHSIDIRGEAVDKVAYVKQLILLTLNNQQNSANANEVT